MKVRISLVIAGCFILACMAFLPAARADEWDQMTKLNFSQPVEIPGAVLPAGTYWFVLADSQSDRDIIQIFSADWSTICATVFCTVPSPGKRSSGFWVSSWSSTVSPTGHSNLDIP